GPRGSLLRQVISPLLVFSLAGLWHGGNWTFVVWGFLQGCLVVASVAYSRMNARRPAPAQPPGPLMRALGGFLATFITLNVWSLTNIFFRAGNVSDAWYMVTHVFSRLDEGLDPASLGYSTFDFSLALSFLAAVIAGQLICEKVNVKRAYERSSSWIRWGLVYACVAALIALGRFTGQVFLYFQF